MGVYGSDLVCDLNRDNDLGRFHGLHRPKSVLLKRARARLFRSALAIFLSVALKRPSITYLFRQLATNYFRREPGALGAPGSLISCPACNSTLGPMPFSRANSSADNLCAAAILAIVSPLRARTLVRLGALFASAVVGVFRRQLVNLTLLLGTTSLFVDL